MHGAQPICRTRCRQNRPSYLSPLIIGHSGEPTRCGPLDLEIVANGGMAWIVLFIKQPQPS